MGLFSGSGDTQQNAPRKGSVAPPPRGGTAQVQAEAFGPAPQLLFHGCQVPRLLQDHHCFQPRSDRRPVRWLLHRSLSTHWWKGEVNGRPPSGRSNTKPCLSESRFHLGNNYSLVIKKKYKIHHAIDSQPRKPSRLSGKLPWQPVRCRDNTLAYHVF